MEPPAGYIILRWTMCATRSWGRRSAKRDSKSKTRFGNPALMIASNLPDIDVLVFATGTPAVSFRRGWTHGVLAQALLPLAFVACLLLWDRWRRSTDSSGPRASASALLVISYVGVLSHVFLDYLNNYGVRLLMPFSGRWFYGDTLFIADVWMWLLLGLGVYLGRRRRQTRPARLALSLTAAYIVVMLVSARGARQIVLEEWMPGARQRAEGLYGWAAARDTALEGRHRRCRRSLRDGNVLVAGATCHLRRGTLPEPDEGSRGRFVRVRIRGSRRCSAGPGSRTSIWRMVRRAHW